MIPSHVPIAVVLCAPSGSVALLWERLFVTQLTPGADGITALAWLSLWAGHTLAQFAALIGFAVVSALQHAVARAWPRVAAVWFPAVLLGAASTWPTFTVARSTITGEWISQQSYAPYIPWAAAAAGLVLTSIVTAIAYRYPACGRPRSRSLLVTAGLGAAGLGCGAVDLTVMPSLFPRFHLFAYGLEALFLAAVVVRVAVGLSRVASDRLARLSPVVALAIVVSASGLWFGMSNAVRSELVLHSPTAANSMWAAPTMASPDNHLGRALQAIDPADLRERGDERGAPGGVDLGIDDSWSVLFLTVDTLRADAFEPARRESTHYLQGGETPFMDGFVARSYRFERAYTQASMTHRSMPPMFRSLESYEDPGVIGTPLGVAMAELHRVPVAVVNNFMIEPRFARIPRMLDGFRHVAVYPMDQMQAQAGLIEDVLDSTRGQPFFAWVHYYCMHAGFFGEPELGSEGGSWPSRYRRSLMWLDGQLEGLIRSLERRGLADHTIIVLTSDHGEGLGDNRVQTHGPTVFEEEVRAPLLIHVPGRPGGSIPATVGNIDIVPTLYDLLGAPPDPTHRGHSLVPLLADPQHPWPHDYYLENKNAKMVALVRGASKLVWDRKAGIFHRFDLREDPTEDTSLYGVDPDADTALITGMARKNPSLFKREIDDEGTQRLLESKLRSIDDPVDGPSLDFMLRLASLADDPGVDDAVFGLFQSASRDEVRLAIVRHMFRTDPQRWGAALAGHVGALQGQRELELIGALARQGQPSFSSELVHRRIEWWVENGEPARWTPWLQLIRPWKKERPMIQVLGDMLEHPELGSLPVEVLEPLLQNLASLERLDPAGEASRRMTQAIVPMLDHPQLRVRIAACRALGRVGDERSVERLQRELERDGSQIPLQQAALWALADSLGRESIPLIAKYADSFMTVDGVAIMKKLGHPDGIPYLEGVAEHYHNGHIRRRAKRTIAYIEKRARRPGSGE